MISDGRENIEQWRGKTIVGVPSDNEKNTEMRSLMRKSALPDLGLGGERPFLSYRVVEKRRYAEVLARARKAVGWRCMHTIPAPVRERVGGRRGGGRGGTRVA